MFTRSVKPARAGTVKSSRGCCGVGEQLSGTKDNCMQVAGGQTLVTVIEQYGRGAPASPHHDWVGVVRRKRGPKVLAPLLKRRLNLSLTRSSWCRRHLFFRVTLGTVAAGRKLAGTRRLVSAETQQHHAAIPPRLHQVSQGPRPDQDPAGCVVAKLQRSSSCRKHSQKTEPTRIFSHNRLS